VQEYNIAKLTTCSTSTISSRISPPHHLIWAAIPRPSADSARAGTGVASKNWQAARNFRSSYIASFRTRTQSGMTHGSSSLLQLMGASLALAGVSALQQAAG